MSKLKTIHDYYDPLKFIKKIHTQEGLVNAQELIDYLNRAYRHAIRKILLAYPASFAEGSPIFDLCIDVILNNNDLTKVTIKWIEDQINKNQELVPLKNLKPEDPNIDKLQLIKAVTRAHQYNLVVSEDVVVFVNSVLALETILNMEYALGFFAFADKSDPERKAAIAALKEALKDKPADLLSHLSTFRRGKLGSEIRVFVKQGMADKLLDGKTVRTVSDFITELHTQVNSNLAPTVSIA
ncbi:hypothetical protein Lgra_0395 [Legionella gratiana]|uniref:Uncharacterized protein n=1 Tax=Legionella gratiana TaxID=45066 RepID=A0A378JEU0_9GAMM|nr:hypothetical protein [Legionella gratiana]KTD15106.1 hypothetical protein Lgra_0395 [Legionella gratiana]STX46135.1 Uncharacterised protein [Legionella gratiana]